MFIVPIRALWLDRLSAIIGRYQNLYRPAYQADRHDLGTEQGGVDVWGGDRDGQTVHHGVAPLQAPRIHRQMHQLIQRLGGVVIEAVDKDRHPCLSTRVAKMA